MLLYRHKEMIKTKTNYEKQGGEHEMQKWIKRCRRLLSVLADIATITAAVIAILSLIK
jgi:hypothetical protein